MEIGLREAKARLSEIVAAAERGERVVITRRGEPAVELVRFRRKGGIDFEKLERRREQLGFSDEGEGWPAEFDDPAFSRRVLGIGEDPEET